MNHYPALPLFPLSSQVFPEGRMQLRIFEPRYLRMVADSLRTKVGFAMCMADADGVVLPIATRVQIIDFEQLEGDLLGITIEGLERIKIGAVTVEADGLKIGAAASLPNWAPCDIEAQQQSVAEQLQQIHQHYQELATLYPQPHYDNGSWVAQRWLEIIPLSNSAKQQLWQCDGPTQTLTLLQQMLQKS